MARMTPKRNELIGRFAEAKGITRSQAQQQIEGMPQKRMADRYRAADRYLVKTTGSDSIYRSNIAVQRKSTLDNIEYPKRERTEMTADLRYEAELRYRARDYKKFRDAAVRQAEDMIGKIRSERDAGKLGMTQANTQMAKIRSEIPPDLSEEFITRSGVTREQQNVYMTTFKFADQYLSRGYTGWGVRGGEIHNEFTETLSDKLVELRNIDVERQRQNVAERLGAESWEELPRSVQEIQSMMHDLTPVSENLSGTRAYAAATGNYYLSDTEYMQNYLKAARDAGFADEDLEQLEDLLERFTSIENEGALREIIELREDESIIQYMYKDTEKATSDHSDYTQRLNNVMGYWKRKAEEYGV